MGYKQYVQTACNINLSKMKKKLFISHASEDKDDFVRPLAETLKVDFKVWYDEYELIMGCSLLEEISKGLANCDFGVVVLSKHFFAKNWPQQELNGLFALEEKDKKIILPIWKGVSKEDVTGYSPILADRMAAKAEDGVEKVVNEIKKAVVFFERGRSVEKPTSGLRKLQASFEKKAEEKRSEEIVGSSRGVAIAMDTAKHTIDILADQVGSLLKNGSSIGLRMDGPKGNHIEYQIHVWVGEMCLHANYINNVANSARNALLNIVIFEPNINFGERFSQPKIHERENYSIYVDGSDNRLWKTKSGQLMTPEQVVDRWLEKLSARIGHK